MEILIITDKYIFKLNECNLYKSKCIGTSKYLPTIECKSKFNNEQSFTLCKYEEEAERNRVYNKIVEKIKFNFLNNRNTIIEIKNCKYVEEENANIIKD